MPKVNRRSRQRFRLTVVFEKVNIQPGQAKRRKYWFGPLDEKLSIMRLRTKRH